MNDMAKKLKKRFEKRLGGLWLLWLSMFVACLVLCGLALYAAATRKDPAGWCQVAIALAELPVILYGLFKLHERIIESQKKPRLEIGVVFDGRLRSEVRKLRELRSSIAVNPGSETPRFALVIRNRGNAAAKSVKVELELKHTSIADERQFILSGSTDFAYESDYRVYVCSEVGGGELIVRAGDEEIFSFSVHPLGAQIPYWPSSPLSVVLQCRVWAEGLDDPPVEEALTVSFEVTEESD